MGDDGLPSEQACEQWSPQHWLFAPHWREGRNAALGGGGFGGCANCQPPFPDREEGLRPF